MTEPNALKTYVVFMDSQGNYNTHKIELKYSHCSGWCCRTYSLLLNDISPDKEEWDVQETNEKTIPVGDDFEKALETHLELVAIYKYRYAGFSHFAGEYYYDYIRSYRNTLTQEELNEKLAAYYD